jgi:Fe-S-cluster containining protein
LVISGAINPHYLYTIRRGEMVFNNLEEKTQITDSEMIKVRERDEGGCIYYDELVKGCSIYEHRPSQCAALKCWDRSDFDKVFSSKKLERRDIIDSPVLRGLIEEHEKRCGYDVLDRLVKRIESKGEEAVEDIMARLRFDFELRPFISEKLKISPDHMDLYFGRALIYTIRMFGLEVRRERDGSFFLTVL